MAQFKPLNRYTNGIITFTRDNEQFLVLRKPLNLEPDNTDTYVTINQDLIKRPDLIAHKAYNNVDLWWVIYEYNNIINPLFDLKIGQTLKIPTIDRVLLAISTLGV